ncbi:MAG: cell division protein ZapA [Bacteroidota bacterium]|jgi:cell division protein ZapA (FtsZ GTPase activity inhibitor)
MSQINIQVTIAGKNFPLTVKESEVESLRKAEKLLADSIELFQKNYQVKDRGDLLSMAALQVITRLANTPPQVIEKHQEVIVEKIVEVPAAEVDHSETIQHLENLVDSYLK